jgi:hypothetical protein
VARAERLQNVLDRAAATYLFGQERLEQISEEAWAASDQKLRLAKSPDGNAAFMRAFPSVYKHARKQTENLICLIATPNSDLEKADAKGESDERLYQPGGAVHEMRELILHRAKLPDQMRLVLGSLRQLAEEMQEADLGSADGGIPDGGEGARSGSRRERRQDRARIRRVERRERAHGTGRARERAELVHAFLTRYPSLTRTDVLHRISHRELRQLLKVHAGAAEERWEAEQREHGMEAQPDGMPLASVGDDYRPDEAWQRALAEKRRLLASKPRSN